MASDEKKLQLDMAENTTAVPKHPRLWVALCCLLLLVVLALLIGIIILAIQNTAISEKRSDGIASDVCTTPHCVVRAGEMMQKIDQQVDPCDNLYEYACGGWLNTNIIPEDRSSLSIFIELSRALEIALKNTINERDAKPLLQFLHEFGGFPVLEGNYGGQWNESNFDLEDLTGRLSAKYSSSIIGVWVGLDDKNSSRYIPHVDQPSLFMGTREYYLEEKYTRHKQAYFQYMVAITTMLGANETTAQRDMTAVLEFETKLANLSTPKEERRNVDALYHLTTLANLTQEVPQFNWTKYFDILMPDENKPIPSTEEICNYSPRYIEEAIRMVTQDTPVRVKANYIMWRLASSRISYLSQRFRDEQVKIREVFYGIPSKPPRYRTCVSVVNGALMFATGRMYVREHFPGESKANVEIMIANLRKAFKDMLEYNEWMDEETKVVAREKIDAMRQQIGYPDWIYEDDTLNEYYIKFNVEAGNKYFENSVSQRIWIAWERLTRLRKSVDKDEWSTGPAVVNAYYSKSRNRMVFPAGILQPPFYHKDSPWYLNYGGIGTVIGHEITHGFDDRGRKFDKDGNLKQWWSDESSENFNERAQCIIDQYSQYAMPEINKTLDGFQTQGENIADNGGMKESYKAYTESAYSKSKLPGFEKFTTEQLFFINFAQVNCRLYRPEKVESAILTGVHSPGRYRAIGPPQNSGHFAKAFSCAENSYMNPPAKDKCVVW
ncbi:membrane metallo-endopeptidase-like 1 [Amphiura filiformis]|uniref:membrane metallo-endopeptidase-like 1 n=1 Tax=Amphiura filiformis TaxID=82378 RepID=UPI003B22586F